MLFAWIEGAGGGIGFGPNTGFNLPDGSYLAPDAASLALDRWNALTTKEQTGYPPLCPDFIVEVRSQSDARSAAEEEMDFGWTTARSWPG
jgi:Uma2 family endonuclease